MDWTPKAKAAIKKAPPFVRTMARKAVEVYAKNKGMATVSFADSIKIRTGQIRPENMWTFSWRKVTPFNLLSGHYP